MVEFIVRQVKIRTKLKKRTDSLNDCFSFSDFF